MAEQKEILFEVINWEKFNPRTDRPGSHWLRLQHNLFDDPNFYTFTHSEFCAWVYILCEASKGTPRGTARINFERAKRVCGLEQKHFLSCFEKCEERQILKQAGHQVVAARSPGGNQVVTTATPTGVLRNDTIRDDQYLAQPAVERPSFDFESVYRDYPRKQGKQRGMKICKTQIRTEEDFDALKLAVEHYTNYVTKNATEPRFIKHFSTFMGEWRDWVDPEAGSWPNLPAPRYIDMTTQKPKCETCNGAGVILDGDSLTARPCPKC